MSRIQYVWAIVAVAELCLPAVAGAESTSPLRLVVEQGEERDRMVLTFRNISDEPVIIYLDRRLAQVELRGERRSLGTCRVPADALPRRPDDRRFVSLAPGERASEDLDLRFPCFRQRLRQLEQAQSIRVSYRTRFATDRLGRRAWTGRLGPVEATLGSASAEGEIGGQNPGADGGDSRDHVLRLRRVGRQPDVAGGVGRAPILVSLELRGPERGRLPVAVRPELFSFQVHAPNGRIESCQMPNRGARPLREFFDRLGRRRVGVELRAYCPRRAFDRPGVYSVRPAFTPTYNGSDVGLDAWTGVVEGRSFLVRVRRAGRLADDPVEINMPSASGETEGGGTGDAQ